MDYMMYTLNADSDEPIMMIDTHIGFDEEEGMGIIGDAFKRELMYLDTLGKKRIQVWINSPGGIVSDGYDIYTAILKTKTKVDTYCSGIAASIAGVIFQAGRTRTMMDYALLMFHEPSGTDEKALQAISGSIAQMIASRSGKTIEDVQKIMKKTTWMSASEALMSGLCDEIENSGRMNQKRAAATPDEAKNFWREAKLITNSILKIDNKNSLNMKNVANKLGLLPEAAEESFIKAIDGIQNRVTELEGTVKTKDGEIATIKADLKAKEDALTEVQNKLTAKEKEFTDLKKKQDDEEQARKDKDAAEVATKAKNMVEEFANKGYIKTDEATIKMWTDKAVVDMDGTKNLLEGLPLNRKAVKIETGQSAGKTVGGSLVANKMMEKYAQAIGQK